MNYKHLFLIPLIYFLCGPKAAAGDYSSFGPFTVRNQNPVYLQTINLTPMRAGILPLGTLETRIDSSYSNIFEMSAGNSNSFIEDMELWRIGLHSLYAPRDDMEVGMEIPFLHTWGGFLDSFIEGFHNAFNLPNGDRDRVRDDQFAFRLNEAGGIIYSVGRQKMNLGDILLHLKNRIFKEEDKYPAVSWFFDLKLPTGASSKGLGSGGTDFGLGLAAEKSYKRIHGYLNTAYYVSGRHDALESYANEAFFSYALALEVSIIPTLSALIQLNSGTPLLENTHLDRWDGIPLDLIIGFRGEEKKLVAGNDLIWQVGFSEDVTSSGPSIDFTAFTSIGLRFDLARRKKADDQNGTSSDSAPADSRAGVP